MALNDLMQRARALAANPSAVAMMTALAQHKSESAAKTEQDGAEDALSKATVSIDLGADGKHVINAKGVPVEDYEDSIAKAYEAPQRELAETLRHMSAGLNRAEIQKQLSSYQGRLAAARELGANPLTARIDAWRVGSGRISPDSAVDQVVMRRAAKLAQFQRMTGGIADDARAAHNAARADTTAATSAQRQRRSAINSAIGRSDLSNLTTDNIAAEAGLGPGELTQDELTAINARRTALTAKSARERRVRVTKTINDLDLDALTPENVSALAEAGDLTPSELSSLRARKKALEDKQAHYDDLDSRASAREARAVAADARAAVAAERAARSEDRSITRETRSQQLQDLDRRQRQIDHIISRIDKNNDHIQANARTYAKSQDEAERAELRKQNSAHIEENKKLRQQLDATANSGSSGSGSGSGSAAAPKVGDVKTFPNGKKGRWDGSDWVAIK